MYKYALLTTNDPKIKANVCLSFVMFIATESQQKSFFLINSKIIQPTSKSKDITEEK